MSSESCQFELLKHSIVNKQIALFICQKNVYISFVKSNYVRCTKLHNEFCDTNRKINMMQDRLLTYRTIISSDIFDLIKTRHWRDTQIGLSSYFDTRASSICAPQYMLLAELGVVSGLSQLYQANILLTNTFKKIYLWQIKFCFNDIFFYVMKLIRIW